MTLRLRSLVLTLGLAVGCILLFGQRAQATTITGSVDMAGGVVLEDNGSFTLDLAVATQALSFNSVLVTGGTDAFAGTTGSAVTWTPFSWSPLSPSPVDPLWTFTYSGATYSFRLDSVDIVQQDSSVLTLAGSGELTITGYDPTPGTWAYHVDPGFVISFGFNFDSATSAISAVPDGGATITLLGLSLACIERLRRRFKH